MAGTSARRRSTGVLPIRSSTSATPWTVLLILLVIQPLVVLTSEHEVWTAWSPWSPCSFTCGRGVRSRYRECVGHTGRGLVRLHRPTCPGRDREYVICKEPACELGTEDERQAQCSEHNTDEVLNTLYHWVPFYGGPNPCELTCLARGYSFYYNFGHVKDGTPCKKNGDDLCVNGHCAKVGCDNHVGSNKEVDDCGVCGGENNNCAFYQRTFSQPLPPKGINGYTEVVKIPVGATHLKVKDTSSNYLALADSSLTYIINGNWVIDWAGRYEMAETTLYYGRAGPDNETITADGPIKEDLHLMLIFRERNPGVTYQFWLPADKLPEMNKPKPTTKPAEVTPRPTVQSKVWGKVDIKGHKHTSEVGGTQIKPFNPYIEPSATYGRPQNNRLDGTLVGYIPDRGIPNRDDQKVKDGVLSSQPTNDQVPYGNDAYYALPGTSVVNDRHPGGTGNNAPGILGRNDDSDVVSAHAWWNAIKQRKTKSASVASDINPQLDDVSNSANRPPYVTSGGSDHMTTLATPTKGSRNLRQNAEKLRNKAKDQALRQKSNDIYAKQKSCGPCKKAKNRAKHFCTSQYVIRAQIQKGEEVGDGNNTRYDVKVVTKYKDNISLLGREYVWVDNRCNCPRLQHNRHYLLMGTLETDAATREGRLQLTRESFVRAYNPANDRRMRSLMKKINCDKYG